MRSLFRSALAIVRLDRQTSTHEILPSHVNGPCKISVDLDNAEKVLVASHPSAPVYACFQVGYLSS